MDFIEKKTGIVTIASALTVRDLIVPPFRIANCKYLIRMDTIKIGGA
jgi:hypothetical protein